MKEISKIVLCDENHQKNITASWFFGSGKAVNKLNTIAELACMGKVSSERLYDILNDHTENATFICSDANHIYNDYCSMMDISHYVIPSSSYNLG